MPPRRISIALALIATTLTIAAVLPWLLYRIGLGQIDGRPSRATQTVVTTHDLQALRTRLRISQPIRSDPISPYSYLFQGSDMSASTRMAWIIARAHNARHLTDHRYWHLSGAALTIWLTRNWTSDELVAKAVELTAPRV